MYMSKLYLYLIIGSMKRYTYAFMVARHDGPSKFVIVLWNLNFVLTIMQTFCLAIGLNGVAISSDLKDI